MTVQLRYWGGFGDQRHLAAQVTMPPCKSWNHTVTEQPQESSTSQWVERKLSCGKQRVKLLIFSHTRVCSKAHTYSWDGVYLFIQQTLLGTLMKVGWEVVCVRNALTEPRRGKMQPQYMCNCYLGLMYASLTQAQTVGIQRMEGLVEDLECIVKNRNMKCTTKSSIFQGQKPPGNLR